MLGTVTTLQPSIDLEQAVMRSFMDFLNERRTITEVSHVKNMARVLFLLDVI